MTARPTKRRLWIGLLCGLTATGLWWLRVQHNKFEPAQAASTVQPFVQMAGAGAGLNDRILREKAEYFDPTPLFFPTEWNYGQKPLQANLRQGLGQVFVSFPPNFTGTEQGIKNYATAVVAPFAGLGEVLADGNQTPFAGMGRVADDRPALSVRNAFVEVRKLGAPDAVISQPINDLSLDNPDFYPLEYIATVGPAGLIGDLVMASGSGPEEADAFFRQYLVKTYRLGERLAPGRYQVLIGP